MFDYLANIKPIDIVGMIGAVFILFAFYRTSVGRWSGKSLWFELDNIIGSSCLFTYAFSKGAVINSIVNLVWLVVALKGLSSLAERRTTKRQKSKKRTS